MTGLNDLHDSVDLVLKHSMGLGVSGVEVYGLHYRRLTINASKGRIKSVLYSDETGIALRLSLEGRIVFSYINTLNKDRIRNFVEETFKQLRSSPIDPLFKGFYEPSGNYYVPEKLYSPDIVKKLNDPSDLVETIRSAIQDYESNNLKVTWLYTGLGEAHQVIANSEGVFEEASTTFSRMFVDVIGVDGPNRSPSIYESDGWRDRIPDPYNLLEKAKDKALRSIKRYKLDLPNEYNIILTPEGFIELFSYTYGEALLGMSYVNKSSPFIEKIGQQIAPECLTVTDDPHSPGKLNSMPFDGEGAPTRKTVVIKNGELKTFLFNHYYGSIAGFDTTGNASRQGYTSPPGISWNNITIDPGEIWLDELLNDGNVILIERIQGVFNAKFQTGDYGGAGTPAWLYKKGSEPLSLGSVSISGNIYRDIESCVATRDVEDKGSFKAPYIMLKAKIHSV